MADGSASAFFLVANFLSVISTFPKHRIGLQHQAAGTGISASQSVPALSANATGWLNLINRFWQRLAGGGDQHQLITVIKYSYSSECL